MKKNQKNIEHEIEQVLHSGSNEERVNTSPFFTTRVMGKVEQLEDVSIWIPRLSMVLKPVLVLLVVVNVVNFYIYNQPISSESVVDTSVELAVNDYATIDNDFILSDDLNFNN